MSLIYIHLSDIHFGQEKGGGQLKVNDDVKDQLLIDAHDYVSTLKNKKANGVIISGDIAYAGQAREYDTAAAWLDRLTAAVGCDYTEVQVVPGNHDIDRNKIGPIIQGAIDKIIDLGDDELDRILDNDHDRELLYSQFSSYRSFAEGYDCPLDPAGSISKHKSVEIYPNRKIQFHGLNTSLICSASKKEKGGLILGKRQRVLPISEPGTELIVIAHHPLNWLQDSEDALKYIRNRARVFISGHEHRPKHEVITLDAMSDLLMIDSGAAVPPGVNEDYNYHYNILEIEYLKEQDNLQVIVHGRSWNDNKKAFDSNGISIEDSTCILKCPNFKKLERSNVQRTVNSPKIDNKNDSKKISEFKNEKTMDERKYDILLLKFFRDLSSSQRLFTLLKLEALPKDWQEDLTHSIERMAFDKLFKDGKVEELEQIIDQTLTNN